MSNLVVYKASAGSGKTFRLAVEYIKMLVQNPSAYRNILAVTFTNKATAEMKERILFKLYSISQGKTDDFFSTVVAETRLSPSSVKQRATEALSNILHDYSMFSISTIDSFVQRIVQNLLWEIGYHGNTDIRLDSKVYIEKAVDILLDRSGDDSGMFEHFKAMIINQLDDEKSPDIRKSLIALGEQLYSEHFRMLSADEMALMDRLEILKGVEQSINTRVQSFVAKLNTLGNRALNAISGENFSEGDFAYTKSGVYGIFPKASNFTKGDDVESLVGQRVRTALVSPDDGWLSKDFIKKNPRYDVMQGLISSSLYPTLVELVNYIEAEVEDYNTAFIIGRNLSTLWVVNSIRKTIKEILTAEGSMLLADSGPLLREFVADSDAPFVYEKIGSRYDSFMLDEFQDTSEIQRNNFMPLIRNSLSEGGFSLVVGDVKQAIYRWRNSDWRILARGIEDDFVVDKKSLDTNFRSLSQIVDFNNHLFEGVADFLPKWTEQICGDDVPPRLKELVEKVYESPSQKIVQSQEQNHGYVEVTCFSPERKNAKQQIDRFVAKKFKTLIPDLLSRGIKLGDIAVLVRSRDEGNRIAEILLSQELSVMSQGALLLRASHAVRLCVAALKLVQDEGDTLSLGVLAKGMHVLAQKEDGWETSFLGDDLSAELQYLIGLRNQPLATIFESILGHYGVNGNPAEFPYIALLHENIMELTKAGATSLMRFVEWWDDAGKDLTLSMPESGNSINIMTVHKSKGLQFPVVIVPYSGITIFNKDHEKQIWTKVDFEPYSQYPLYPILFHKSLINSKLRSVYIDEKVQTMVDSLNLLYVAYTRPEKELYVILTDSEANKGEVSTLSDVVIPMVKNMPNAQVITHIVDEEDADAESYSAYIFGEKGVYSSQQHSEGEVWMVNSYSVENKLPRIATQLDSAEFFKPTPSGALANIERGKLMHRLFSFITTQADVSAAVYQLQLEGLISDDMVAQLELSLSSLLAQTPYSDWFGGSWQVMQERSIINTDGCIYRPDRVMIRGAEAVVVDFKFGGANPKYAKQVSNYMGLIGNMGYTKVDGFVWYVDSNELSMVAV